MLLFFQSVAELMQYNAALYHTYAGVYGIVLLINTVKKIF